MRDMSTRTGYWSPEAFQLYGMPAEPQAPRTERVLERIHPDDRDAYLKSWAQAVQGEDFDDVQLRVLLPEGKVRWLTISISFTVI
jgi:PAS domain-containing protein